jgi:nucleotide-binding universal stress UspA family protein
MIKTILVPIDVAETEAGAAALGLAQDLAKTHDGKIVLLNVVEKVPGFVASQLPPKFHEEALAYGETRLKEIAAAHGIAESAEIVVREGHPSTEILEYAKAIGAGLIVIASHDPGLADYLLGSVAARIVRHAHCSVLVARKLEG